MAQDYFSGNLAQFGVNGTNYSGNEGWNVENTGEEQRVDNTAGGGYSDRIITMKDLVATIEGKWDASQNLLDNPPNLQVGSILTNVKLYLNGSSSPFWLLPKAVVQKVSVTAKTKETTAYSITIANKGTFTPPTGTFTPTV